MIIIELNIDIDAQINTKQKAWTWLIIQIISGFELF